jgi:hypothetical protein
MQMRAGHVFNSLRKAKDQHKDDEGDKEGEENLRKSQHHTKTCKSIPDSR